MDSWVLITDGKISAVGSGQWPELVIQHSDSINIQDMEGSYALPGLIDTHAHVTLGPVAWKKTRGRLGVGVEYDPEITRQNSETLLRYGVTTIRNPGGDTGRNVAYRKRAENGLPNTLNTLTAGLVIENTEFAGLTESPTPERSIESVVEDQFNAGVDYVKFYHSLSADQLSRGIAKAQDLGIRSIVHTGHLSWTEAAELGVDSIVHMMPISPELLTKEARIQYLQQARPGPYGFFEWFEHVDLNSNEIREMIAAMVRHQVHLYATLVAFEAAFWGDHEHITENPALSEVHPAMVDSWRSAFRFDIGWKEDDYKRARAVWPKVLELTRQMHESGVPMSLGTDLGNPWVVPGRSLHREMRLHADAGISNWAVLRMATSGAAKILGLDHQAGRIVPGLQADILFLNSNPLDDIRNTLDIAGVVHNGQPLAATGKF